MPYKSKRKRLAYAKRWRRAHPYYSRDYMRTYNEMAPRSRKTAITRKRALKYAKPIKEIKVEFDP
jgi:hypothetical protein